MYFYCGKLKIRKWEFLGDYNFFKEFLEVVEVLERLLFYVRVKII